MRFSPMALALVSTTASAQVTTYTPFVDVAHVEPGCRPLARIPGANAPLGPSLDAAVSTASCVAIVRLHGLDVEPSQRGVQAIDEAIAPANAMYDTVIAAGDPEHAVIAEYAKLDLLRGAIARLLDAIPKPTPQMAYNRVAEHQRAVMMAGVWTEPWLRRAEASRRRIARVVYRHPELATHDPVVAYMIASVHVDETLGIATR